MTKTLHVVFKTHLDIGFTDLAEEVVDQYLYDFIPRALDLAESIPEKFTWTTGSWLIALYLKHPDVSDEDKGRLRNALSAGTIRWHALPFTVHSELMDGELMHYATTLSKGLNQMFNKQTIAGKMTDVPGHTISLLPYLAEANIKYIHVGVNASSALPKVPKLFVWKGYDGSEVIMHYAADYGEVFEHEGWSDALYFAHSHDNMGPPKTEEVIDLFSRLQDEYPDYDIVPSSLDAFAQSILKHKAELPVIEEEIGDTWIHGIASDPKKIADYRKLLKLRLKWLKSGKLTRDSEAYKDLSENLLLIAEHTWGANGNVFLPDYRHFPLEEFKAARQADLVSFNHDRSTMDYADLMSYISTDIEWEAMADRRRYSIYEKSWQEQRDYIGKGIEALPEDLKKEALDCLRTEKEIPVIETDRPVLPGASYDVGGLTFGFDSSGGLNKLQITGYDFINEGKAFGGLSYERFDFSTYARFFSQYSRLNRWTTGWATADFGRRGIEAYPEIRQETLQPYMTKGSMKINDEKITVVIEVEYQAEHIKTWGLPEKNTLVYVFDTQKNTLDLSYKWEGKQANRMPEAYWLETSLNVANPSRWTMTKIDHPVNPLNVIVNGNRNMHVLSEEGMHYSGYEGTLQLRSSDAPLISLGRKALLTFDNHLPQLNEGMYVNLYNNVWGTNFPAWFEDDIDYHVQVKWTTQEIM